MPSPEQPSPERQDYAQLLLGKAEGDLRAALALADASEMSDDVVGFHAQQATEKAIKTALVLRGVDFARTHDLDYLAELATDAGLALPKAVAAAEWLTSWAAELRYDELGRAIGS